MIEDNITRVKTNNNQGYKNRNVHYSANNGAINLNHARLWAGAGIERETNWLEINLERISHSELIFC